MPRIRFMKNRAPIDVPVGANLMAALLAAEIPVASSCRGDGICAKCRLRIVDGDQNLSAQNQAEEFLREKFELARNERISCQVQVLGDITIDATYW